jgi:hypothetical protein
VSNRAVGRRQPAFFVSFLLHVAALVVIGSTSPPSYWRAVSQAGSSIARVTSERLRPFAGVPGEPTVPPADESKDLDPLVVENSPTTLIIQNFTFDFGRVSERATALFPFLSLQLSSDGPPVDRGVAARRRLVNPFGGRPGDSNPPLVLSENALQTVVDSAWSRRYRWRVFRPVRELTGKYNADTGRLPLLLRRYADQTMLQPYLDTEIPDMRLWTELGIAADHTDYIAFITKYAIDHPSSKATTELLFLLDKLAQGSYDALATLVGMNPVRMEWTRSTNREAYDLFTMMRRYYRSELALKNLDDYVALRLFFDRIRIAILSGIVRTTPNGYRASDARFLIGSIYWRQLREDEAVRWWRGLTVDPEDSYHAAAAQLLEAIRRAGPNIQRIDRGAVNDALEGERRKWVDFWERRLERFGYSFDVY